ncbi:tetratricopeptide repeat protein [Candidatus Saccharibacteria bacterium]|nr:tetratricopeptide repeat protein [Candidatus Saccharibacteria bacterium]
MVDKKRKTKQLNKEHKAAKKLVDAPKTSKKKLIEPVIEQPEKLFSKKHFLLAFLALGSFFGILVIGSLMVISYSNKKTQAVVLAQFSPAEADIVKGSNLNGLIAYNIDPQKNYQGAFLQAKVLFENQKYQESVKKYEQIIAVNNNDPEVLENYSYSLMASGDPEQARQTMSRTIELTKSVTKKNILQAKLEDMSSEQ